MKKLMFATMVAVVTGGAANAAEYYWQGDTNSDWSVKANWRVDGVEPTALPGAGDTIMIDSSHPIKYDVSNAAEKTIVDSVDRIATTTSSSEVIIYAPTGTDISIPTPISNATNPFNYGIIRIQGGGIVRFTAVNMTVTARNERQYLDYDTKFMYVEAGEVHFPTTIIATNAATKANYFIPAYTTLSEGTKLYLPSDFDPESGDSHVEVSRLRGTGEIYQVRTGKDVKGHAVWTELRIQGRDPDDSFGGKLCGAIRLFCNGVFNLTGTESTMDRDIWAYSNGSNIGNWSSSPASRIGLMKLGMSGQPSSGGTHANFSSNVHGGNYLYLGNGETTDKRMVISLQTDGYYTFDAGANGGINFGNTTGSDSGILPSNEQSTLMGVIGLTGSNTTPCVIYGPINAYGSAGAEASPIFLKKGTGTWRFADRDNARYNATAWRTFGGAFHIHEGTLQFDSVAMTNEQCSIGTASQLTDTNLTTYANATKVNWQFALGGKSADLKSDSEGTLEFTGINNGYVVDRPVTLRGNGRLLANAATGRGKAIYRMVAPELTKNATLTLDGNSTLENEVADVSDDGINKVSVVKQGTGKWVLSGNQTFSGNLEVKNGTLVLRQPESSNYTWYRFTVKEQFSKIDASRSESGVVCVYNFGLFAEDGANQALNLTCPASTNIADLAKGQVGFGSMRVPYTDTEFFKKGLTEVFINSNQGYGYYGALYASGEKTHYKISPTDSTTWLPIVMRLPEGASKVTSYDWVYYYSKKQTYQGIQWTPKRWSLEGSVDGIHWENVKKDAADSADWEITLDDVDTQDYFYVFSKEKRNAAAKSGTSSLINHSGGCEIIGESETSYDMLSNVGTVKVSGGATLQREGKGMVILDDVEVDATSANTIDGFSFVNSGTINVTGSLPEVGVATLGTTLANCSGTGNLANWEVSVNGIAKASYKLGIAADGKLTITRPGFMVIVR